MATIGELTKPKPKEVEVLCGVKCPFCGGEEFLVSDIYETTHYDENGNRFDCVDFECQCESDENCCKDFTLVYTIEYFKTIMVV